MRPTTAREHWSYSAVSQYLRCPLRFYFERVLRLPRPRMQQAQALGSAVHDALASYHRTLMTKTDVVPQQVRGSFLESWERLARENSIVAPDNRPPADIAEQGLALIDAYLGEPPPQGIRAVEEPMLVPIVTSAGEVLEKPLLVIPDLITISDDHTVTVHEIKTSGRAYSDSEVATSLQPTCYAHAWHEVTGEEPLVEFTVLIKTKAPRVQRVEAARNVSDYRRLGDLIQMVERAVDESIFYPQESPLNCSGCPYFRPCHEWKGPTDSQQFKDGLGSPTEAVAC